MSFLIARVTTFTVTNKTGEDVAVGLSGQVATNIGPDQSKTFGGFGTYFVGRNRPGTDYYCTINYPSYSAFAVNPGANVPYKALEITPTLQ